MSEQIKGPIWPYHNQIFYITTIISRLPLQTIYQWHSEIIPLRLAVLVGYYNPCPFSMDSHWDQRHSWIILDIGPSPTCPFSSWPEPEEGFVQSPNNPKSSGHENPRLLPAMSSRPLSKSPTPYPKKLIRPPSYS